MAGPSSFEPDESDPPFAPALSGGMRRRCPGSTRRCWSRTRASDGNWWLPAFARGTPYPRAVKVPPAWATVRGEVVTLMRAHPRRAIGTRGRCGRSSRGVARCSVRQARRPARVPGLTVIRFRRVSGQPGENRNENPVAGRGPAPDAAAHNLPQSWSPPNKLATQHDPR